jgi:CheY-like chemotaxis protein
VHGGTVTAQSPGPHCGATFTITLPTAAAPAQRSQAVLPEHVHPAGVLNILLIEDHVDTAEVMAQLIRTLGHDVTTVGRVDDALAATQLQEFDLVISDVGLPDGTGLDFIMAYREHWDAPAVALTGFGTDEDVRRCLAAGFTSHLTKPVNFAQLEAMIESAINLKAQKQA